MNTFVINMDKCTERLARMKFRLKDFERICADNVPEYPYKGIIPKSVLGCARSHVHAWNIVHERGYDKALILEDDAVVSDEILKRIDALDIPNECDIYLVGYTGMCDANKDYAFYTHVIRFFLKLRQMQMHENGECFIPESFAGFHAYIITRQGAEKLKNTVITHHIDYQISNTLDVCVYAHVENLVLQDMIDSNNIDTANPNALDYMFSIRDKFNIPFSYILNSKFYGNVCMYHIIFLICGFLNIPIVIFTLNPLFIMCFFIGRILAPL